MKRRVRVHLFFGVFLLLALPFATSSAVQSDAYAEGIYVSFVESHHQSIHAELTATKHVDGDWRESEIHFVFDYAYVDGSRHIDGTVVLDGDPDWLEVSNDLGWGGLDTVVWMEQTRVICASPPEDCGEPVTETVPVEIHIALWANDSYSEQGDLFIRPAEVTGTITIDDWELRLSPHFGLFPNGYNFSDQFPYSDE